MLLVMRFFLEIKVAFDCPCKRVSPSTVVPDNGNKLDENNNGIERARNNNGNKVVNFDFGYGIVQIPEDVKDERQNKIIAYFTKKHEKYQEEEERRKEEE